MRHWLSYVIFIVSLLSVSMSYGQKVKANDRRAAGLVPYPRIGRNSEIINYPRTGRAVGLINIPRTGRSELPVLNVNNRYNDLPIYTDLEFYTGREIDPELFSDQDNEEYFISKPTTFKHNKIVKDREWLAPERVRVIKEYYSTQKIDNPRLGSGPFDGSRNNHGQSTSIDYVPRLGRETEHEVMTRLL